jgi:hypothetical protein
MEVSGQFHALTALYPANVRSTYWIGVWVGPSAGVDTVAYRKTYSLCREFNPGRSARSASLYRLIFPGSYLRY